MSVFVEDINGDVEVYEPNEYTNYFYDGRIFVVTYKSQWVGIHPVDKINKVRVK